METIDFIPLVKAYPALIRKYGEVSCVAGVELTPEGPRWIRLYPVPFRSRQRCDKTSLGVFRPRRVIDFKIEKANVDEAKLQIAKAWSAQTSLLDGLGADERTNQLRELEQVPWTFRYCYECAEPGCRGHGQSIIDWEIAQFYRRVRHFDDWREQMRKRWFDEVCEADRDTAFFVGNMHQHPGSFLILGVWWPPQRPEQLTLADLSHV